MWVKTDLGSALVVDDVDVHSLPEDSKFLELFAGLAELQELVGQRDDTAFVSQLLLQREAQITSPRMKGLAAQDQAYVVSPFVPFHVFDSMESLHFAQATDWAWAQRRRKPYGVSFLKDLHRELFAHDSKAGEFRDQDILLSYPRNPSKCAVIMLAPPNHIGRLMRGLSKFGDATPQTHRIAACAVLHHQLVAIHPFIDGNGRIVRIVTPLFLRHYGLLDGPNFFMSEVLLTRWWEYYQRLQCADRFGEIDALVRFFAAAVCEQTGKTMDVIRLARRLRADLTDVLKTALGDGGDVDAFVCDAMLSTTFPLSRAAKLLAVTVGEAQRLLNAIRGRFGLHEVVESPDPVYQFGDVYWALGV